MRVELMYDHDASMKGEVFDHDMTGQSGGVGHNIREPTWQS